MAQFEAITGGRKRKPRFAGDVQARLKYLPQLYEAKADEKYQEAVLALRGQELEQAEELGRGELELGGERLSLSREQQELQKKQQKKANIISGAQVASTAYLGSQISDVYAGEAVKDVLAGTGTRATAAELATGETVVAKGGTAQGAGGRGVVGKRFGPTAGVGAAALSGVVFGPAVAEDPRARKATQFPAGQRLSENQAGLFTSGGAGAASGFAVGGPVGAIAGAIGGLAGEAAKRELGPGEVIQETSPGAVIGNIAGVKELKEIDPFFRAGNIIEHTVPKEVSGFVNDVVGEVTGFFGTHYCTQVDKTVGLTDDDREILKEFLKYAKTNHRDVVQYYLKKGPEVVRFIHEAHGDDTPQVFIDMNKTLVQPTIEFMKAGEPEKAYRHYANFGDKLFHDYTPHLVEKWTMIYRKDICKFPQNGENSFPDRDGSLICG